MIAIPGATKPDHVRQNSRALTLELSDEEFAAIDRASTPTPDQIAHAAFPAARPNRALRRDTHGPPGQHCITGAWPPTKRPPHFPSFPASSSSSASLHCSSRPIRRVGSRVRRAGAGPAVPAIDVQAAIGLVPTRPSSQHHERPARSISNPRDRSRARVGRVSLGLTFGFCPMAAIVLLSVPLVGSLSRAAVLRSYLCRIMGVGIHPSLPPTGLGHRRVRELLLPAALEVPTLSCQL